MRSTKIKILLLAVVALTSLSCGVTRHTPQGSYFLQRIDFVEDRSKDKEERIPAYVLERYIRQSPNKRLLGTNFYVWAYNLADPDKDNGWNRFKRKVGQMPVYYDNALTQRGAENLKVYMNSQGYYSSEAAFEVDTTRRRRRAFVTFSVEQGDPYIIESHNYIFHDTMIRGLVFQDSLNSLVKIGAPFNATTLDRERERIANNLRQRGYYNFSTNNVSFLADTLMGDKRVALTTIIKQYLAGYNADGEAIMENNTRYRINDVNVAPDFDPTVVMTDTAYLSKVDTSYYRGMNIVFEGERANVREKVLRQSVPIYANTFFNSSLVDETYKNLISIGYFKSAKVLFNQTATASVGVDTLQFGTQRRTNDLLSGSPLGHLSCNVLCTPALTQSVKLEAEGSSTTSFYGLSLTAGYTNRNVFRGAEAFDVALTTGYEYMKSQDAAKRKATELGLSTGLSFPRFIIPFSERTFSKVVQPRSKLELSANYQDRPYYTRTLVGASWNYSWRSPNGTSSYMVRPVDINLIDMDNLDADFYESLNNDYLEMSFETQMVAGLAFSYSYNSPVTSSVSNATMFRYNFESSGNLVNLLEHAFDTPSDGDTYHVFGIPYAQYVRTDINVSRKIMLGEVTAIAARWYSGVGFAYGNSLSLPFDRLFYTGGSNSMRGWSPRTLGPGSTLTDGDSDDYPNKVGDIRLEANLELRFPIWGNIHGATFLDCGNVWYLDSNSYDDPDGIFYFNNFYKQLGLNTGLGIRIDVTFAVLRLDWGIQLHNPNYPVGERWISGFDWDNTSLNFGVGYPF